MTFDLSPIPIGSTIQTATYNIYTRAKYNNLRITASYALFSSTPLTNNNLVPTDYQQIGSTPISNVIPYASVPDAGPLAFTLLPSGLAHLIPGQIAKLAVREASYDAPNIAPPWRRSTGTSVIFWTTDWTTHSERPYLEVTYLPP
jgi:hypothetical protein